ncbi:DUF721 domain-containing protein [Salisaeta longa]|uniref:DUF721 domain-containing protein n=1 Tax=Salisaeta longa TaxID=503170 RepID=UPI001E44500D|nr:DUF721 domain-containing protein [Salisaeta longa]
MHLSDYSKRWMNNRPEKLGHVLGDLIDRMGLRDGLNEGRVLNAWEQVTDARIRAVTQRLWMKNDTLYVKISSAAWRQELHWQRRTWRTRINEHLGEALVGEIQFR